MLSLTQIKHGYKRQKVKLFLESNSEILFAEFAETS